MRSLALLCSLACAALALAACDDTDTPAEPDAGPRTWSIGLETGDAGALLSVWGPAADDVWTVGGQLDAGAAWHFDGTAWSRADVPDGPLLNWVHGCGDELWMVGNDGRALRRVADGAFEAVETGETQDLWGVWCAEPGRAWAVGGDAIATETPADPVIIEWDGAGWSRPALPTLDRESRAWFKVWGTGVDNVIVVGSRGTIARWDGSAWVQELAGTSRDFVSLWGTGPDDIVAVGGRANGMAARFDGSAWQHEVLVREPGMNGVWVAADGQAHIVGLRGRVLDMPTGAYDYTRDPNADITLLHAIWGIDSRPRFAVGGTLDSSPPWTGILLEADR